MNRLMILLLAALVACDEDKDSGETEDTGAVDTGTVDTGETGVVAPQIAALTDPGGCGDIAFVLSSADRTAALVFWMESDLTRQAYKDGKATATIDLSAEGSLELHQGNEVTGLFCNDAFEDHMVIDETWTATSGTVTLTVVSDGVDHGHAAPGTGTILIEDAVLELDGADPVSIESLSWEAAVGWLPG